MTESTTYRLESSGFAYAPGLVRWAINGAAFEDDRERMCRLISNTWQIPLHAATQLVTEAVPFSVDGETVVFTIEA